MASEFDLPVAGVTVQGAPLDIESTVTTAADGSTIDGLFLYTTGGTDTTKHGIWLRARGIIKNVFIVGFPGNGINIEASAGAPDIEGNANNWIVNTVRIQSCGMHGLYINGADANAGICTALDCTSNNRSGIYDSSFLGNTFI